MAFRSAFLWHFNRLFCGISFGFFAVEAIDTRLIAVVIASLMVTTAGGGRRGASPVAPTEKEFMDTIDTILLLALSLNLIYLARHCTTLRGWALRLHSPPTGIIRAFAKRKMPPKPIAHNMMGILVTWENTER